MNIENKTTDYPLFEIDKDKVRFHYDVSDPQADHSFWTNAVDDANYNRNKKLYGESNGDLKTIGITPVRTVLDYYRPESSWFDWDTMLWIRVDDSGNKHYFLEEHYMSPWDDMPVYTGGEISEQLFKEYMKKINNSDYY